MQRSYLARNIVFISSIYYNLRICPISMILKMMIPGIIERTLTAKFIQFKLIIFVHIILIQIFCYFYIKFVVTLCLSMLVCPSDLLSLIFMVDESSKLMKKGQ